MTKLKQCIQSLATRLQTPEGSAGATMVLREGYPFLEPLVNLAEVTRKLVTAYNTVSMKQCEVNLCASTWNTFTQRKYQERC